ncbi:MAG TPA: ATP synthase F1 subunit epsilon [bacterium]
MINKPLHMDIVTPDGVLFSDNVEELKAPGIHGEFGILPGHTEYLVVLKTGVLAYRKSGAWKGMVIDSGYAVVENDNIKIIISSAEPAEGIDFKVAASDRDKVMNEMKDLSLDSPEFAKLESLYHKAIVRIQAYEQFAKK